MENDRRNGFAAGFMLALLACSLALNYALYTEKLVKNGMPNLDSVYIDGIKGVARK